MNTVTRDPFGLRRLCYDRSDGAWARSVRALLTARPALSRTLDRSFLEAHLGGRVPTDRTLLASVAEVPPGHALTPGAPPRVSPAAEVSRSGDLPALLAGAVEGALAEARSPAVALSGGLDSALVLALVRAAGARVPAYVLAPTMEGYGELDEARRTARALDAELVVVPADEDAFLGALPDALEAMEAPLYNLHPVAKLLLARALRRDGVDLALSGDGADHVLRRDRSADYLPLTQDLFDAAGLRLRSPFLDARVVEHLLALPPDREKRCLRAVAARYAIPAPLVHGPKVGRLAPAMDVRTVVPEGAREALEGALGRALDVPRDAAEATRQGTLAALVYRAGAW